MIRLPAWLAATGFLGLAILPLFVTDAYFRNVLVLCGIYATFAISLDLVVGYVGVLSFGHAAFLGVGAYAAALLRIADFPYWMSMPAGALAAGAVGALAAVPALRLRGVYFAIATLAMAEILRITVNNWTSLTGGPIGLNVPPLHFVGLAEPGQAVGFYYLAWGGVAIICFVLFRFFDSRDGRALIAIRDNEQLSGSLGVPVFRFKAIVLTLSAMMAGWAGAVYAPFVGVLSPDLLSVNYSALALLMVIIGGRGTIMGAVAGAIIFSIVSELFRAANDLRMIAFSGLLIILIAALPRGLISPLIDYLARRRRSAAPRHGLEASS